MSFMAECVGVMIDSNNLKVKMTPKLTIERMFVGGLFGRFDYSINFTENGRRESGITIITAPNGYGKSTLLKLIDDLVSGNYFQLSKTSFSQFLIEASDGTGVIVERIVDDNQADTEEIRLNFELTKNKSTSSEGLKSRWSMVIKLSPTSDADEDWIANTPSPMQLERMAERELGLRRIGPREWRDSIDGRVYRRDQLVALFGEYQTRTDQQRRSEPIWLSEFRRKLAILYIPVNRLRAALRGGGPRRSRGGEMVEIISDRVVDQIRRFNVEYAEMGRRYEQDFPSRVINAMSSRDRIGHDEIMRLMEEVREQEIEYQELGLLSEVQSRNVNIAITDPSALLVLGIYLRDIAMKLRSLKETADRMRIFSETLNEMLLFKRLEIVPDYGFQVVGESGAQIPLRALSSGEQHLIVLLGEIIFESVESGVILLDEPEISFHPEWQEFFPEVLTKVVRLNKCMVVMATHSPTLIQDKWESVVELADQVMK